MCGITGQFDTRGTREAQRAVLQRMNDSQLHCNADDVQTHKRYLIELARELLAMSKP